MYSHLQAAWSGKHSSRCSILDERSERARARGKVLSHLGLLSCIWCSQYQPCNVLNDCACVHMLEQ